MVSNDGARRGRDLDRMHVRESGDPQAPAVVFLHAVGNSGSMWDAHVARLAGFHCLAPDLPGFGRSNRMAWPGAVAVADAVASTIQSRADGGRAHVVGLSLGGSIAHHLLARHPEALDRVVIDGSGVLPWWGSRLITAGVTALSPFLHTKPVIKAIGDAVGLDDRARADMRKASPRAFRQAFRDANHTHLTVGELEAPCPTLLVAGERETEPPVRSSNAALAAVMPHAEARYVAGCGHGWLGARPALHLEMVHAWLTGLDLPAELQPETTGWDRAAIPTAAPPSKDPEFR